MGEIVTYISKNQCKEVDYYVENLIVLTIGQYLQEIHQNGKYIIADKAYNILV